MEFEYSVAFREKDGVPHVISSRIIPPEFRTNHPYLAFSSIPYKAQPNGFPAGKELDRASDWEELIEKELAPYSPIFAGHITGTGVMISFYYLQKPGPASVTIKTGLFKKTEIQLENSNDVHWGTYCALLEPTELEMEASRNSQLLQVFESQGDDRAVAREVDFTAYFNSASDRDNYFREVEASGYHLTSEGVWETDQGQFGINIGRVMTLEDNVIHPATLLLTQVAERHNGEFDGWAAPHGKKP